MRAPLVRHRCLKRTVAVFFLFVFEIVGLLELVASFVRYTTNVVRASATDLLVLGIVTLATRAGPALFVGTIAIVGHELSFSGRRV
jgi:hypothetical protein